MAAEYVKCAFGLNRSIMKNEFSSASEFFPLADFYHTAARQKRTHNNKFELRMIMLIEILLNSKIKSVVYS